MTSFELRQKKQELIQFMIEVCGMNYTFGWLQSAYVYPDGEFEEDILLRTFKELKELKAKK